MIECECPSGNPVHTILTQPPQRQPPGTTVPAVLLNTVAGWLTSAEASCHAGPHCVLPVARGDARRTVPTGELVSQGNGANLRIGISSSQCPIRRSDPSPPSFPTKARSSPAMPSWTSCGTRRCVSAWPGADAGWTTCSSSGSGAPSSTRMSTCAAMRVPARRRPWPAPKQKSHSTSIPRSDGP